MKNILLEICNKKREEIIKLKERCSFASLEKILNDKKNRNFKELLINSSRKKTNNIIAEIKKASPSAGILINNYKPETIAIEYEKSGVGAISILTEKNYFQGEIDHLSLINNKTNIPILRKDFIIDKYQILESKIYKADAILLILSILNDNEIKEFLNIAKEYGLDCLIEAHTEEELKRAINIGYPIIGINNRNLKNLSVDINNTLDLIKKVPKDFIIVAESGIKTKNDIIKYNNLGVFNFLIGESILSSPVISVKINQLLN
tara:strand:- start:1412 stop:2197 length:786 start_codon:yes stop_codon:yes gene_type:complete